MSLIPKEKLKGIVLAGGRSRRLGRDKATLLFRGHLQVDRAIRLLKVVCGEVFVSLREDQDNPSAANAEPIYDRFGEIGPLGGLLSAFYLKRDAHWFVLSCGMPFLSHEHMRHSADVAEPHYFATAFIDREGIANPFCAIYHPAHKDRLLQAAKQGERSLSVILSANQTQLVAMEEPSVLDSIVTSEDYYEAQKRIIGVKS